MLTNKRSMTANFLTVSLLFDADMAKVQVNRFVLIDEFKIAVQ